MEASLSSPDPSTEAGLEEASERLLRMTEAVLASGSVEAVSDETVQRLMTAAVLLYSRKCDHEERVFFPFAGQSVVSATDIVVVVSELLRSANLNTYDLALWLQRPRPGSY